MSPKVSSGNQVDHMLGKPLQGLPQAQLDPGDLVSSSRTWSFFPSSSVCHSFSLKQLPSKWWQRWLPSTASRTAPYNQREQGGKTGVGSGGGSFPDLAHKNSHWLSKSQVDCP